MPEVIPYLDAKPSAVDGEGTAVPDASGPFVVGSRQDFHIDFTVGKSGIAKGGFIMLQISPWWGWAEPQISYPEAPGYVEVKPSFAAPVLEIKVMPLNRVMVFSRTGTIPPGADIKFSYTHARVDRFAEAKELFQIFTDGDGDGNSACISRPPTIRTVARPPVRLRVTGPSIVQPGEEVEIRAVPLDSQGNWSKSPFGVYRFSIVYEEEPVSETGLSSHRSVNAEGGEKSISFNYIPEKEGIYFFRVDGPQGLRGKSNVLLCRKGEASLNLYFGDIHGHSRQSDGTGTPEDYFRYAREVSGLDISSLTDHADFGTIPIRGEVWDRIKDAANQAYQPGSFVTFVAFEWTNWIYGHRNVYYRDADGPIFRSIDKISDTPDKLWKLIEPYNAMTIAHHVGGGPIATDWNIPPGPKEWLVEISSIHGSSEYYGCESCIYRPVRGSFVRDALNRGYKLGIIGSGDNHDGHPGNGSVGAIVTGVLGVYSTGLTREEVWAAFERRQVYGTSGPKIILNFRVADSPMGSEVSWKRSRGAIPIAIRAIACDEIDRVEVIRNGKVIFSEKGDGVRARYLLQDPDPPAGTSWYYLRIIQRDGQMAWSSPVWVVLGNGE
ncbi:MAG: CehA/McbA family metallohydrolase [Candidatus Auribacterota bacterium]|nr:CehA/McbA family metallohydrolase [Candidatus Auribacterota bacterium]